MTHIIDGRIAGVPWKKARASGGTMTPKFLVLHDTAGRLDKGSSVNWFCDPKCTTSAHFVVERDGSITQMVRTDRRAFHAGVSKWNGISGLNSCSIGIEIVNPGKMDAAGTAWFGKAADPGEIVSKASSNHGSGHWLSYTPAQIDAVVSICRAVVEEYPDCNEIVTHWMISPGRKIDTNPLFPLDEVRRRVFDPLPTEVPPPAPPPTAPVAAVPNPVVSAAQSKTVWSILSAAVLWVVSKVEAAVSWIVDTVTGGVGAVQQIRDEVEGGIGPIQALGGMFAANVKVILPSIALCLTAVAIARHVRDRNRIKELEAELGVSNGKDKANAAS